jgi:hypothetical protein
MAIAASDSRWLSANARIDAPPPVAFFDLLPTGQEAR